MTFLRDILPRVELLRQDRLPGKYPTYTRTGDATRRGNNKFFFDDTITVIFTENEIVSYPTTFSEGHRFLDADLSSSILSVGTVTKTGVDQFVVLPTQNEVFAGFTEDRLFAEDIKTERFYLTGSDITDVGLGFANKLGSKTIIKIPIEIASAMTFPSQTKGNYYYNKDLKRWDVLAYKGLSENFTQNPGHRRAFGMPFGYGNPAAVLFNCFGQPQSDNWAGNAGAYAFTAFLNASPGSLLDYKGSSLLTSGGYAATSSQFLDIASYLHAPFLLEKAHLELPFQSGPNWYASPTAHSFLDGYVSLTIDQTYVDGPAVTFGLLNQISNSRRDIVLSGTIVPERDCTPWFEEYFNAFGTSAFRTLNGFTRFSTPGFKVPSADFLGSARISMDAAQSHGYIFEGIVTESVRTYGYGSIDETPSVASWGRGQNGPSGRSIFGGEYILPVSPSSLHDSTFWNNLPVFTASDLVYNPYLVNGIQNKKSPYLISPKDKLIAYLTIGGAAMHTWYGDDGGGGPAYDWLFSGSHEDAGIPAGTAFLTLYGSFVKEEAEFHDTLNQRLETNEIHEIIGNDPVLDQFDVAYSSELSGSYLDRIFSGTMTRTSNRLAVGSHFVPAAEQFSFPFPNVLISDSLYKKSWISSGFRNVQGTSDERIFDTLLPGVDDISKINLPTSLAFWSSGYAGGSYIAAGAGMIAVSWDNIWDKSFPFEPRYSTIQRKLSTQKLIVSYNSAGAYSPKVASIEKVIFLPLEGPQDDGGGLYYADWTVSNPTVRGVKIEDFAKFFYGFGDRNNSSIYLGNMSGSVNNPGIEHRTKLDIVTPGNVGAGPKIRGWKYGLFSGVPMYSKTISRRDHFGQLRDSLEQRIDTKFLSTPSPVSVKFVTQTGERTLPEYTYSSNLSTEATSSLPYFDNAVRNREEPLAYVRTNQSNVVI